MISIHSPKLVEDLKDGTLFVDTNVFVGAFAHGEAFGELFFNLKSQGCAFLTIPSVTFEFLRGADTIETYNKRVDFIRDLATTYPIERHLEMLKEFTPVMQRVNGKASYTDFLLCACLYKFKPAYLITEDRDIPLNLFDRKHLFIVDSGNDIRCYGLYKFSEDKFNKTALRILNES